MVHLRSTSGTDGRDLTPIFWSDNYFSLLPGEQREVTSSYEASDLNGGAVIVKVDGYNIAAQSVQVR